MARNWGPFGLASAPEVFQDVMSSMLDVFENVEVSMDDILIHHQNLGDLQKITSAVIDKIRKNGLKLNRDKCKFGQTAIKFLGHILSQRGLEADPDKSQVTRKEGVTGEIQYMFGKCVRRAGQYGA